MRNIPSTYYSALLAPCLLVLGLLSDSSSAAPAPAAKPLILILGDSLSAGYGIDKNAAWVALLEKKMKAEGYDGTVINASITGETTGGGLSRLPPLLTQYQPDILVIELGANDGLRGFPTKVISSNLSTMVKLGQQQRARILLVGVQLPLNYGPRYTQAFEKVFVTVSRSHNIALAPSLLGNVPLDESLMQKDNLHPNAAAQPYLLRQVWPSLQPLLTAVAPPR